jgi:hypothetical protein
MTPEQVKALRAGDAVVNTPTGRRYIVRQFQHGHPIVENIQGEGWMLPSWGAPQWRRETFAEFITRPTGFGRISWPQAAIVFVAALGIIACSFTPMPLGYAVLVACMGIAIIALMFIGAWRNYTHRTA